MTRPGALFVRDGDRYLPTERTQGPWAIGFQFGGAPAALVAHVVEAVPTLAPMMVARLTVDLLRPVPMEPLEVHTEVRREGKRLQVVDVSLRVDGLEVVAATALRLRRGDLSGLQLPAGEPRWGPPDVPLYEHESSPLAADAMRGTMEYALCPGDEVFVDRTWVRLCIPVIEGEAVSPLERTAYVADASSGMGHPRDAPVTGINADLTLNVVRPCVGEWLCMEGTGWTGVEGVGVAQVTLSDEFGVVAGVSMSRLVDRV